jgi:hypothetical protein
MSVAAAAAAAATVRQVATSAVVGVGEAIDGGPEVLQRVMEMEFATFLNYTLLAAVFILWSLVSFFVYSCIWCAVAPHVRKWMPAEGARTCTRCWCCRRGKHHNQRHDD